MRFISLLVEWFSKNGRIHIVGKVGLQFGYELFGAGIAVCRIAHWSVACGLPGHIRVAKFIELDAIHLVNTAGAQVSCFFNSTGVA